MTEEGVQYLTEPTELAKRGTPLGARYEATDDRMASVKIESQAEGGWRISLTFSSGEGIQRMGEVLSARPGEHFHGLTERVRFAFNGPSLAYHIFPGSPKQILNQYTEVIGRPSIPPRWAFGTWRWRDNHANRDTLYDGTPYRGPYNSMAYEDIVIMGSLDVPLDAQ